MTTAAPTLRLTNAKATHDETKVSQAVAFLRHPQVQSTPLDERVAFLQQKGVGAAEIAAALARCGLQLPSRAAVAAPQRSTPLLTGGLAVVAGALGAPLRNYVRSSADDREPPPPPPAPPPPPSQGEEAGSAQLAELAELSKSLLEQHDGRLRQLEAQQTTAHRELKAELQELRGAIEAAQATLRTELLSGIAQLHAAPPVAAAAVAAPAAATPTRVWAAPPRRPLPPPPTPPPPPPPRVDAADAGGRVEPGGRDARDAGGAGGQPAAHGRDRRRAAADGTRRQFAVARGGGSEALGTVGGDGARLLGPIGPRELGLSRRDRRRARILRRDAAAAAPRRVAAHPAAAGRDAPGQPASVGRVIRKRDDDGQRRRLSDRGSGADAQ